MKHLREYKMYLMVLGYLLLLRVVLFFTVGMALRPLGLIYDLVVMMFWVGVVAYFIHSIRWQKVWYIVVVVLSSLFAIVDSVYYDYFDVMFSRSSVSGLKWLQEGNTLEYDISIPLVAYLITPIIILIIVLIVKTKERDQLQYKYFRFVVFVFVAQVGLFLFWGNQTFERRIDYYRSDSYLFETMHDRTRYSEKYGYYNYHLLDLTRIRKQRDPEAMMESVNDYFDQQEVHQTNEFSDQFEGYNLVMIIGETLETRFIDETLTPNLYQMREEGLQFDNYYTTVFQQGATCNSEYMGMSGLSAISSTDWSNNICDSYSENAIPYALPNQLRDIGYNTYYFHSGYEWFYNRKVMVPHYGFDTVKFQEDLIDLGYVDFQDRFDTQMLQFVDEFVAFDEPFMMTLLTYSMHGAYNQTEFEIHADQFEAAYPDRTFDPEIRNYMLKLIEFDTMLGMLKDRLDAEGVLDETLFVIYPDHYPYMMDYEVYTEHINVIDDPHEVRRQDLIIYNSSMTPQVIHTPGSQIDITPTLLNMLNSDGEFTYFMGVDLLSTDENYILFADLTIGDGENILYLDEEYIGDPEKFTILEEALADKITMIEIQKELLWLDYFNQIE